MRAIGGFTVLFICEQFLNIGYATAEVNLSETCVKKFYSCLEYSIV